MSGTDLPKISDETVNVFLRAAHEAGAGAYISGGEGRTDANDDQVRAGLAAALVASGYRREADVLREAADHFALHWYDAQQSVLIARELRKLADMSGRATALEQSLPLADGLEGQERSEEKEHG